MLKGKILEKKDKKEERDLKELKLSENLFERQYYIDLQENIIRMSSSISTAYRVIDLYTGNDKLFAYLVGRDVVIRYRTLERLNFSKSIFILKPVSSGVWHSIEHDKYYFVLVYTEPKAGRLVENLDKPFLPYNERDVIRNFIRPMHRTLASIFDMDITHRCINPENIYYMDDQKADFMLGECLVGPPGFFQTTVFDPITSAISSPYGKGNGQAIDDMFSFGVTFLTMVTGRVPLNSLNYDEIMMRRLTYGSYAAYTSENTPPVNLTEILRGLLQDDEIDRWSIEHLETWLNGSRSRPLRVRFNRRSKKSFMLASLDCRTVPAVAYALMQLLPQEAFDLLKSGDLQLWLRQSMEMPHLADSIQTIIHESSDSAHMGMDAVRYLTIARVVMLLYPGAPIILNNVSFMLDGFGDILANAFLKKYELYSSTLFLNSKIAFEWASFLPEEDEIFAYYVEKTNELHETGQMISSSFVAHGIERCLYVLNKNLHCLSPLLSKYYIVTVLDILIFLDEVGSTLKDYGKMIPVDRHILAFIAQRYTKPVHAQLDYIHTADDDLRIGGILSLYSLLQWHLGPAKLPFLTQWIAYYIDPIIDSYFGKTQRENIRGKLPAVIETGNLPKLYHLLESPEGRHKDRYQFVAAVKKYSTLEDTVSYIIAGHLPGNLSPIFIGHRLAAMLSIGIGLGYLLVFIGLKLLSEYL